MCCFSKKRVLLETETSEQSPLTLFGPERKEGRTMLTTAICDDNPVFSRTMKQLLEQEELVESVSLFDEPVRLQEALQQGQVFDVIFMDVDFEERQAGLAAASAIYKESPTTQIIYITGYNDLYAQQVLLFDANLTGYITKPVQKEMLERYLKKAQERKAEQNQYLTISIKGRDYSLRLEQIQVLESRKHQVKIRTDDQEYIIYDKLSNLLPKLSTDFIQCHKSFIVNARHIERFATDEIFMKGDENGIPISRAYRKQTKDAFFRFIHDQARNA